MKNISEFKKGDIITRVLPALPYRDGSGDRSYMGEEMIFIGIANGQIYLKSKCDYFYVSDRLIDLAVDLWSDGWDNYVDPYTLLDGNEDFIKGTSVSLQDQLDMAIENEDFMLAEKLRKQLEKLNKKA